VSYGDLVVYYEVREEKMTKTKSESHEGSESTNERIPSVHRCIEGN
jgi:hypothetical protein